MADLLSDADVGLAPQAAPPSPNLLSDADVGLSAPQDSGAQAGPQSFTDKLANLWEHPPAGPSIIGAARSLYDAVMTPGRTIQAANDYANKGQITDSDIPVSTQTLMAPAANMAQNIIMPAPGVSLQALPKSAEKATASTAAQAKAANIVAAPLKDSGINTAQAAEQALSKVGPEAVLADVDPRLTQMAGTVAAKPGPGQQILRNALEARNSDAGNRVVATTNQVMGEPIDLSKAAQEIYQNAKINAAPLYEQAYQMPVQATPELQQALSTPVGQMALKRAKTLAMNNPQGPPSAMFNPQPTAAPVSAWPAQAQKLVSQLKAQGVADADIAKTLGIPAPAAGPSVDVRGLHLVRQAFDDMISRAKSPVTSAGKNNLAAIQNNRAVVDRILKQVPQMAQADSIFSDNHAIQDAMSEGLNIFKNSRTPEDIAGLVSSMTDAEKSAYQQAARVAVRNAMGTARNDAAAARGLFSKEFNKEKLAAVLGPDEANKILGRINAETAYANTDTRVLRNSETAARAYGKDALEGAHGFPDALSTINYSTIHAMPRHLVLRGINRVLSAAKEGRQQEIETEVAKLLSLGRSDRAQLLSTLYREAARRDPTGKLNLAITPFVLQHASGPNLAQSQ